MKTYRSIALSFFALCAGYLVLATNLTFATSDGSQPFYETSQVTDPNEDKLTIPQNLTTSELASDESTFAQIRNFFGLGTYTTENAPALAYIRMVVNMVLGLVSLISLIMIIAAFYLIFFSKQEESLGKAKKMLIGVAIALAVMGLSRYIVSYFYEIFNIATGTP